jgi:uncharacterized membrane protein
MPFLHIATAVRRRAGPADGADAGSTLGERLADRITLTVGSWPFILTQSLLLLAWLVLNASALIHHWDPYPFILLNLALSFQAAYTGPIVLLSSNRAAAKDRATLLRDLAIDEQEEREIVEVLADVRAILAHLKGDDGETG